MAITQKLREIGGIINSTDLNYNFNRMQEDLQLAVEGVVFKDKYSEVETMTDRNNIPAHELIPGLWVAVAENGRVYEYSTRYDIAINGEIRNFGLTGDIPAIPYRVEGDPSSGIFFNAGYVCNANDRTSDWKYFSNTMNSEFNDGDMAVFKAVPGTDSGTWSRVPKWIQIMDVTSILENNLIGKLEDLHTEDKTRIVNAINEIHDDLGTIEELTTNTKTSAVAAINELDTRAGELEDLNTEDKTNLVSAISEVDANVGPVEDLTTENKIATWAINELDREMGALNELETESKTSIVSAMNEIHDDLGTLSDLTTTKKDTAVSAINELDVRAGKLPDLTTGIKSSLVSAINEVDGELGPLSSLTTANKTNAVSAINELKSITDTLRGATIVIGRIYVDTEDITPELLNARALEIMGGTIVQAGWTLVDNEQHEWHWNGENWQDMEQPNIYPAQNDVLGLVRGSATGDISITDGNMSVLRAANSDNLNGQPAGYYATLEQVEQKADKSNVLEKTNTVAYAPTEDYHPVTKKYADDSAGKATWGRIDGDIENQEDLRDLLGTYAKTNDVLTKTNTTSYNPTQNYHPATKQYVDNKLSEGSSWGNISGEIEDQLDLQNELSTKQDRRTAWNTDNFVVGTEQPGVPATGYVLWIDTNG